MKTLRNSTAFAVLILLSTACASSQAPEESAPTETLQEERAEEEDSKAQLQVDEAAERRADLEASLQAFVNAEHRSDDDIARNESRNPVETLMFFGYDPGASIVEIWPGPGWYTDILAPLAREHGGEFRVGLYGTVDDDPDHRPTMVTQQYLERIENNREVYGEFSKGTFDPPDEVDLGPPESAQMVMSVRNLHMLHSRGVLDAAFDAFYEVLQPGGTLGVIQHRAPEGSDPDAMAQSGYLPEAFVIERIEAAGFKLEESSELNANPDDDADHEHGVWSLPPVLRGGEEKGEDHYRQIGESDRMTLRFVKPDDG